MTESIFSFSHMFFDPSKRAHSISGGASEESAYNTLSDAIRKGASDKYEEIDGGLIAFDEMNYVGTRMYEIDTDGRVHNNGMIDFKSSLRGWKNDYEENETRQAQFSASEITSEHQQAQGR